MISSTRVFPVLLVICLANIHTASGLTRQMEGGVAPDRHVEVVVSESGEDSSDYEGKYEYYLVIWTVRFHHTLFKRIVGWQCHFTSIGLNDSSAIAYWSKDSRYVAIAFQASGEIQLIRLFRVPDCGRVREVDLPDLTRPALSALYGESIKSLVVTPVRWSHHTLELDLAGTTSDSNRLTNTIDFEFSTSLNVLRAGKRSTADLTPLVFRTPALPNPPYNRSPFHQPVSMTGKRITRHESLTVPM